jgi:transposase
MPVLVAARLMGITDTPLRRVVQYYVGQAIARFDLRAGRGIGLHETACKRGHHYVTVFIDLGRRKEPLLSFTPVRGKDTMLQLDVFMTEQGGVPGQINKSVVFLKSVSAHLPNTTITPKWLHMQQTFTRSVGGMRNFEVDEKPLAKNLS